MAVWILCAAAVSPVQSQTQAGGQEARAAIGACIAQLDPALDVGYARIAARCPHLTPSLERSGWAQWLPRGWKEAHNDLSAGSLEELRTLVARELEVPATRTHAPSVARLNEVLAGLGPAARERSSLWSRFRAWLRTVVERNKPQDDRSWLDKMIQRNGRSQTVVDLLTYAALGLIVVLAGVIIANEMRAAGLVRSRALAPAGHAPSDQARRTRVSWHDVERAATREKPRLLLELVIAKLTELRHIPPAGALTVRELTRMAEFMDVRDRERLNNIALTAERARYSAGTLEPEAVGAAIEGGRELLERLDRSAV